MACLLLLCLTLATGSAVAADTHWDELSSDHFIVYHKVQRDFAQQVLRSAEEDFGRINRELGFDSLVKPRHLALWRWDDRCRIYLHPSHGDYLSATGAPQWSGGQVDYENRVMHSFTGSEAFLRSVLPHELTHILFRELVGPDNPNVPRWLDEGVAQFGELEQRAESLQTMARQVAAGEYYAFPKFQQLPPTRLPPPQVQLYYAQAASVVHFLVDRYGSRRFTDFLANLRDGYPVERALSFATGSRLDSLEKLEQAWRRYLLEIPGQ